jgi:hypothetical protein
MSDVLGAGDEASLNSMLESVFTSVRHTDSVYAFRWVEGYPTNLRTTGDKNSQFRNLPASVRNALLFF